MTRIYRTALIAGAMLGIGTTASAQFQSVSPGAAPAESAEYQPVAPTEEGWVLKAEQGSCLAQKGSDSDYRFQMTSRGRILLSAPNLGDQQFSEGQSAALLLIWSDGVQETVNAAQLRLPGGGSQNLLPRQVYIFPFETTSLATRFPADFTLSAFRDGQQVFYFNGMGAGPYFKAYNDCSDTIYARSQPRAPILGTNP